MCNVILDFAPAMSRGFMARARKGERGRETRARIVDAATRLFAEQGYVDTTMAAIAADAGVAVQTLYLSFGSKGAILKAAHDIAVAGDDEPIPVLDRPWVAEMQGETDGPAALAIALANTLVILERVAPIFGVIQAAAADPDVASQLAENKEGRRLNLQAVADELATKPGFASSMTPADASDVLYAVISEEVHRLLVIDREWPVERWRAWTHEVLATQLFPDGGRQRARSSSKRS